MAEKLKDPLNVKIGAAIKAAREHRGKVAREIAESVGTSTGAVGNWESGQNAIAAGNFFKVADFLNVDARALSQGKVVYLDDPKAVSIPLNQRAPTDPLIVRLWELLGEAMRLEPHRLEQIVQLLENRIPNVSRRRAPRERSKSGD